MGRIGHWYCRTSMEVSLRAFRVQPRTTLKCCSICTLLIENKAATFLMRVDGDSMRDAGILHGDLCPRDRAWKAAPHDLRRTCAKLCRKAGGDLEQIQLLLGHASVQTTEHYLGTEQNLVSAVNDGLGLDLG
jgi:hypothetical protein